MRKSLKTILCLILILLLNVNAFAYDKAFVICDVLNVRVSPNTDCEVINKLYTNTSVDVIYTTNTGWCCVKLSDNSTGFVSAKYLQFGLPSTNNGLTIANDAHNYLGCSYVYGASGPSSFDCSGFTSYLYKKYGYSIPRTASMQGTIGTYVDKSNLQLGDLVFFSNRSDKKINHVGIYTGNGNFIHASTSTRGVVKDSLSSNYYTNHYITARRIV